MPLKAGSVDIALRCRTIAKLDDILVRSAREAQMAVSSEASSYTVPHRSDPPAAAALSDPLPMPAKYAGADKVMTVALIFMFFGLFVWLISDVEREFYAYLTFLALLTFIFVGILQATGVIRTASFALGGSVAVFVGLTWATIGSYDKYHAGIVREFNREIARLSSDLEKKTSENENIMRYSEHRVGGTVQLLDGSDLSRSLLSFTLRPEREDVTGPFAGSGDGETFRANIRLPLRRNITGEEHSIFTELNVSYPGYYSGCVILEKGAQDFGCTVLDANGSFHLTSSRPDSLTPLRTGGWIMSSKRLPLPAALTSAFALVALSTGVATAEELIGVLEAPSGATAFPVPDVEMRLCSQATDECRKTYTGPEGAFRFSEIAPGLYRLEAETRSGVIFESVTVSGGGQNAVRMVIP